MSNETKRDVFKDMKWELISNLANTIDQNGGLHPVEDATKIADNYATRYAAALPDDLPVIPKEVGEILRSAHGQTNLLGVLETAKNGYKVSETLAWIIANQNTFASAWLLGLWRVEETGEIVKAEAEK